MKFLRALILIILVPPALFILVLIIIFIIPSSPNDPIEVVFEKACGTKLPLGAKTHDRNPEHSMFPQGFTYSEDGLVQINVADTESLIESLENNPSYVLKDGFYENFEIGKVLKLCKVSTISGHVEYKYVEW